MVITVGPKSQVIHFANTILSFIQLFCSLHVSKQLGAIKEEWSDFLLDSVNNAELLMLLKENIDPNQGGISSSILSVFFTDKFALSQSDARISVAYKICQ